MFVKYDYNDLLERIQGKIDFSKYISIGNIDIIRRKMDFSFDGDKFFKDIFTMLSELVENDEK